MTPLSFSSHALQRMASRGISREDVAFVLRFARVERRTGIRFHFLGWRQLPAAFARTHGRLEGVTVLCCADRGTVITVYRETDASRDIRRLPKRDCKRRGRVGRRAVQHAPWAD